VRTGKRERIEKPEPGRHEGDGTGWEHPWMEGVGHPCSLIGRAQMCRSSHCAALKSSRSLISRFGKTTTESGGTLEGSRTIQTLSFDPFDIRSTPS
jgi:hypothetical protein